MSIRQLCLNSALLLIVLWQLPLFAACRLFLDPVLMQAQVVSRFHSLTMVTPLKDLSRQSANVSVISSAQIRSLLGSYHTPRTQLRAAVNYLKDLKDQSQLSLALNAEELLKDISILSDDGWQVYGFYGNDGSIAYIGLIGHALIINGQGEIYMGLVDKKTMGATGVWLADYSSLELLSKKPQG